eukprot:4691-Heterococcus_DN1.PRE.1
MNEHPDTTGPACSPEVRSSVSVLNYQCSATSLSSVIVTWLLCWAQCTNQNALRSTPPLDPCLGGQR